MIARPIGPAGSRTELYELLRGSISKVAGGSSIQRRRGRLADPLRSLRQGKNVSKEPGPVHLPGRPSVVGPTSSSRVAALAGDVEAKRSINTTVDYLPGWAHRRIEHGARPATSGPIIAGRNRRDRSPLSFPASLRSRRRRCDR